MKVDPNKLKTRDPLLVRIIQGVTKSGVRPDRKKEAARRACRRPVKSDGLGRRRPE